MDMICEWPRPRSTPIAMSRRPVLHLAHLRPRAREGPPFDAPVQIPAAKGCRCIGAGRVVRGRMDSAREDPSAADAAGRRLGPRIAKVCLQGRQAWQIRPKIAASTSIPVIPRPRVRMPGQRTDAPPRRAPGLPHRHGGAPRPRSRRFLYRLRPRLLAQLVQDV